MLVDPFITWDGDIATIEVWIEGKKELSITSIYNFKKRKRVKLINPNSVYSSGLCIAEQFVQRAYDRGNKVDHINAYMWY